MFPRLIPTLLVCRVARALLLVLAACAPVNARVGTPVPLPAQIGPGERLLVSLDPAGAPEAAPTLTVVVRIHDDVTGKPMEANVYWSESEEFRMEVLMSGAGTWCMAST